MSSFLSQQLGPLFGPDLDYEARKLALQKAKLEQQNFLSQQSAQSKLGYGNVDPQSGVIWNAPTAASGNYTDAETGVSAPISSALPDTQNLLRSGQQQTQADNTNLLRQANPSAFMNADVNRAVLLPQLKASGMSDAQIQAYLLDPKAAGEANAKASFPEVPKDVSTIDFLKTKIAQFGPGTPEAKPYEDQLLKMNYVPEMDPLKRKEMQASIDEKGASAANAVARTKLLEDGGLTDDTMGRMYEQLQAGQPMSQITGNLGRGQQGANNLTKFNNYVTQRMTVAGFSGADIARKNAEFAATKSGMIANEKASATITRAADELNRTADLVEASSAKVDRLGFKPVNELENLARDNTSDPAYGDLAVKIQGVKTAYAQAMARTGVATDASRSKADALISTARNHKDLMARINAMRQEANAALQATQDTSSRLGDRIAPQNPGATQPAVVPPGTPFAKGPNNQILHFINGKWQ